MTDSTNNKELVAAGHEFARHMSSDTPIIDIAKMVTRLASQLDVTTVALRQANAELKASVAAEIEWEKVMMKAVGEDGIADVVRAIEKLQARTLTVKRPQPLQVSVDFSLVRRALSNAGIAAPEIDEDLCSTHIRQILKFVAEQEAN